MWTHLGAKSPCLGMGISPVPGLGGGDTFTRRIYTLSLGRQGESRELVLPYLLMRDCLHIEIILLPKRRILEQHLLIPFKV